MKRFELAVAIVAGINRLNGLGKVDLIVRGEKPDEDKIVLINGGEGGKIESYPGTESARNFNTKEAIDRGETVIEVRTVPQFEFKVISLAASLESAPVAIANEPIPVVQPERMGPAEPALPIDESGGESIFKKVEVDSAKMVGALRPAHTFLVELALSDTDKAAAERCYSDVRHGVEDYHTVRAKWYVGKGDDEASNLKAVIKQMMSDKNEDFMANALLPNTRISIRISDKKQQPEIEEFIRERLGSIGYGPADVNIIMSKVKFIRVSIDTNIEHLNPALDLLVDIGMMECDRYKSGAYGGEMPQNLRNGFLALLKIAVNNLDTEIAQGDVWKILDMIFDSGLVIRPINWKDLDQQNRANQQLAIAA